MKTNYHTHTTFCDGNDTPEAMLQAALQKGFDVFGFSGHSMYPFAAEWHIAPRNFDTYKEEIRRLKAAYGARIGVLYGFEADYLPPLSKPHRALYDALQPDFLIGSVHYITENPDAQPAACRWFTADGPVKEVADGIRDVFGGDGKKAVQTYFSLQRDMMRNGEFDIAGHIDVIRKRNGTLRFFDETEPWYKRELAATAEIAAKTGVIVEINTGGIARKAIDDCYPSAAFLAQLRRYDVPVTVCSDAHAARDVDCAFDLARRKALDAGYRETAYLLPAEGGVPRRCTAEL